MARTIPCESGGCPEVADMMVVSLRNGETISLCAMHYQLFVLDMANNIAQSTEETEDGDVQNDGDSASNDPVVIGQDADDDDDGDDDDDYDSDDDDDYGCDDTDTGDE